MRLFSKMEGMFPAEKLSMSSGLAKRHFFTSD